MILYNVWAMTVLKTVRKCIVDFYGHVYPFYPAFFLKKKLGIVYLQI